MNEIQIRPTKEFNEALQALIRKRNALAHSDSILDDFRLSNPDDPSDFKLTVRYVEPETSTIGGNGKITKEKYGKLFEDFDRHYEDVKAELYKIDWELYKPTK